MYLLFIYLVSTLLQTLAKKINKGFWTLLHFWN